MSLLGAIWSLKRQFPFSTITRSILRIVEAATDALRSQYRRKHVDVRGDAVYASIENTRANISEATCRLQEDVDRARAQFEADKAAADELKGQKAPSLYGMKQCFKIAGNPKGKTPFERILDAMFAQMMAEIMRQMVEERQRQAREEAEKHLYERRKGMWGAREVPQGCEPRAIDREMSRTGGRRVTSHMQEVYEKVQSEHPVEEYEHE